MIAFIGNTLGWILSGALFVGLCVWAVHDARTKERD